jgi:hypothetical protein
MQRMLACNYLPLTQIKYHFYHYLIFLRSQTSMLAVRWVIQPLLLLQCVIQITYISKISSSYFSLHSFPQNSFCKRNIKETVFHVSEVMESGLAIKLHHHLKQKHTFLT